MTLESALLSVPVAEWRIGQAVIFDWHDGPRKGACALSRPACEFYFELLDERPTSDSLDDRLLRLSALYAGAVEEVVSVLQPLGEPAGPVWVPVWKFPSEAARELAEQRLRRIEERKQSTPLVVATRDLTDFQGFWNIAPMTNDVGNWFAVLGIPEHR